MSNSVLVVLETKGAGWHRMSFEALAAGQKLANDLGVGCSAVVLGESAAIAPLAAELATKELNGVWAVGDSLLAQYTADGWVAALQQLIAEMKPKFVVLPHTYQVRDFAPALATRLGEVLIGDVTAIEVADAQSGPFFMRQWMQGKLNVEYRHRSEGGGVLCVGTGRKFSRGCRCVGLGRGEDVLRRSLMWRRFGPGQASRFARRRRRWIYRRPRWLSVLAGGSAGRTI